MLAASNGRRKIKLRAGSDVAVTSYSPVLFTSFIRDDKDVETSEEAKDLNLVFVLQSPAFTSCVSGAV